MPSSSRLASKRAGRSSRRPARASGVTLTLTDEQVIEVCRAMGLLARIGSTLDLLGDDGAATLRLMLASLPRSVASNHSQSLLRALFVFAALPSGGGAIGIVALARSLELNTSTVHRYLQTFVLVGLVTRNDQTREYRRTQPVASIA